MRSNKKEPHDAAQSEGFVFRMMYLVMKIIALIFFFSIFNWLSLNLGIYDRFIMFLGGYIVGQYMLQEWNDIKPKNFK